MFSNIFRGSKMAEKYKTTKNRRKRLLSVYALCVPALWFVFFAVYSLIISCTLLISGLNLQSEYRIEYHVGQIENKAKLSYEVKSGEIETPDGLYVNFSEIADICSFSVSGDPQILKYKIESSDGDADYLTLCINEGKAFVNSTAVSLPSGIIVRGESVYLPVEFINNYVCGININMSEEKENTVVILVEGDYSLALKNDGSNEKIDISGL